MNSGIQEVISVGWMELLWKHLRHVEIPLNMNNFVHESTEVFFKSIGNWIELTILTSTLCQTTLRLLKQTCTNSSKNIWEAQIILISDYNWLYNVFFL